jgi:hypothetical protein
MEVSEVCDAIVVSSTARSKHSFHISELNPYRRVPGIANTKHLSVVYNLFWVCRQSQQFLYFIFSCSHHYMFRPPQGLPTFADQGCHVVSVTDPYGRILGFLDRSRYFSIK